jgi:hypothetical protein
MAAPNRSTRLKNVRQKAFLAAYVRTGSITRAAQAVKMERVRHYQWLKEDAAYAKEFEAARTQAGELLEAEAIRRAMHGYEVPVFQGGKQVGVVTRYSDTLLIFLLKAARPEKYRGGVARQVPFHQPIDIRILSDDVAL